MARLLRGAGMLILLGCSYPKSLASEVHSIVDKACQAYNAYDCELVHAVVYQETKYRLDLLEIMDRNKRKSYGLMMVQCETARDMGLKNRCEQLSDSLMIGLRFGIAYLNYQLDRYRGNVRLAVSAYNMGTAQICKNYNPGHCYPGEEFNYNYVNNVWRRYSWLKNERQKPIRKFLPYYKAADGSETSQINSRSVSQITSAAIEDSRSE